MKLAVQIADPLVSLLYALKFLHWLIHSPPMIHSVAYPAIAFAFWSIDYQATILVSKAGSQFYEVCTAYPKFHL